MITSKDIDAMEERLLRMSPWVDVTTVNVIRSEIKFLRDRLAGPCPTCAERAAGVAVAPEKKEKKPKVEMPIVREEKASKESE